MPAGNPLNFQQWKAWTGEWKPCPSPDIIRNAVNRASCELLTGTNLEQMQYNGTTAFINFYTQICQTFDFSSKIFLHGKGTNRLGLE
jgi:hypothetical protein